MNALLEHLICCTTESGNAHLSKVPREASLVDDQPLWDCANHHLNEGTGTRHEILSTVVVSIADKGLGIRSRQTEKDIKRLHEVSERYIVQPNFPK